MGCAGNGAGNMRDDEPNKSDRAADRYKCTGQHREHQQVNQPTPEGVDADGGSCFLAQHQAIQRLRLRPEKDCCRQHNQCDKADVFSSGAGQGAHRPELDGHHTVRIACYRNDKVGKCCQQCIDNHAGENQLD